MTDTQAPISTDNSEGAGPKRIYIYKNESGIPEAQPGEVPNAGGSTDPNAIPATPENVANSGRVVGPTTGNDVVQPQGSDNPNALPEPTPVDNTAALIDQKRQQAIEALKADGFDGYTPLIGDGKNLTPDDQSSIGSAIQDIMAGFNVSLAKTLSLPREKVDQALGLLGLDYMQHGSPQQQTVDALNRMGIPAYEVENLANKIGRGALPALATWAAMQLAAPSMAANTGTGAFSYVAKNIGEWAVKHPIVGMWLGQTSSAGGEAAADTFGDNGFSRLGGELAGGIAPGMLKAAATLPLKMIPGSGPALKAGAKMVGKGINELSDNLPTELSNAIKKYNPFYQQPVHVAPKTPLIDDNLDANRIQTFAKDQIYSAQVYQDKAIENAINSIPTTGTVAQVQARTHDLVLQAEKISKRIVSGFWDRVPLKTRINVSDLNRDVHAIQRELVDSDNVRPDTLIDKIISVVAPKRDPATGQMMKAPQPTIQKLRDLQSQIGTAITEERARDAPREGQVRNLVRLSEAIDDNIAKQMPNNTSIAQAREMSKRHNDLFSRGPINDILSKRRTGDFRVPTGESVDTLMQKTDGLAALKAVQEGVSTYPRIPTTRFQTRAVMSNPFAVTQAEKDQLDQMVKSAEDSIRASFREAADAGPQKAVAFSQKNYDEISALGKVAGELQFAASKIATAMDEKKTLQRSALARFAETSPDAAVANIFAQKDPAGVARQLMLTFRGDPDALEGLRNEVLNHFIYKLGKTNPVLLQRQMQSPRYGNLMEAVLDGDQLARLNRIINTAVKVGAEDETGIKQAFRAPFKTAGRIAGAAIGRKVTNNLQGPAIFSKAVGSWAERTLGGTEPGDLLAQAVLDPHWEQLLYSRIPQTTRDMKAAETLYRRIFASINTAQQVVLNRLSKEKDND